MKIKYLIISLVLFLTLTLSIKQYLFSVGSNGDSLKNSFIVNLLEMDSDTMPSLADQELAEGGIIFDNSVMTKNTKVEKQKISQSLKNILKKMPDYDDRVHLIVYKIKKDENLSAISKKYNVSIDILKEINNIKKPELVKVNDKILVPSKKGIYYKIKSGDTLIKIAKKYNTKVELIAEHNKIENAKIIVDKSIFLPGVEQSKEIAKDTQKKGERSAKKDSAVKSKEKSNDHKIVLSWPLRGPITSGFGTRKNPLSKKKKFHCGLDIGANEGTSVKAAGDGKVIFSGWKDVYGNMIVIEHENGYITVYAHNSINFVGENEEVKRGDVIASSGKTGAVTGAHLHFEVRKGVVPLNPFRILK
jgi:murein DD-endopeptidase MepM/ murein hydrolase activator NlpD